MRKILPICIIGVLIISGFGALALNDIKKLDADSIDFDKSNNEKLSSTHTTLAEYGTATWCGYCRYAHGALKELYAEGELDFLYVTLVDDKNTRASNRVRSDYNIYGFPTVWFDGGYKVNVGASSVPGAKSGYTSSINSCSNRAVDDIYINLLVTSF